MSEFLITTAEAAIKRFPFHNYGLDDVDPNSEYAEWVPALAAKIVEAVVKASRIESAGNVQAMLGGQP